MFRNPHSFVHVEAPDENGTPQGWAVEWGVRRAFGAGRDVRRCASATSCPSRATPAEDPGRPSHPHAVPAASCGRFRVAETPARPSTRPAPSADPPHRRLAVPDRSGRGRRARNSGSSANGRGAITRTRAIACPATCRATSRACLMNDARANTPKPSMLRVSPCSVSVPAVQRRAHLSRADPVPGFRGRIPQRRRFVPYRVFSGTYTQRRRSGWTAC